MEAVDSDEPVSVEEKNGELVINGVPLSECEEGDNGTVGKEGFVYVCGGMPVVIDGSGNGLDESSICECAEVGGMTLCLLAGSALC